MAKVSLRAYNREIEAMIDRNHLDEAVAHCQHILKTFPKHLETYRLLGKAYLEARRHNEAVDIFTRVLAAEPNDFVAHVGMSIIRDEQNKLDDAIWHMERAFEVKSANSAIQAELQRLYGRRDGMPPTRIRMTRGALAHMYIRGELYPQAISETKGVLEEDAGRSDMQVLLAKAYYRSGQKNDAADAASAVLKRYPFCLDANLVLAEILSTDRPESAQVYRHRVIELDPYAAQAVDDMFRAREVSDAAVSIDHLDWNGQPVGMSTDWGSTSAIGLESGLHDREEQPDWLRTSKPPLSAPAFASKQEPSSAAAQPADDIPDFLRAAGWGASSGAFDESKSSAMFADESAPAAQPLEQGDLPDWVKAMAPSEAVQPSVEPEEAMPDWINKIGTEDLPVPSADDSSPGEQPDWPGSVSEPSAPRPPAEQPDWLKGFGQEEQPAAASADDLDWLKGLEQEEPSLAAGQPDRLSGTFREEQQPASVSMEGDLDWLKGLGQEEEEQPAAVSQPDWLKGFDQEEQPAPVSEEQPDWLRDFGGETVSSQPSGDLGFLDELTREPQETAPSQIPSSKIDAGGLGTGEQEQDDSFAWLEGLAARQGATEGLLTKPEERLEEEPDWVKQAKDLGEPVAEEPAQEAVESAPVVEAGDLGRSEQERDDSFAWLEALAARQGASEGLLTKPEERQEQEPEWVRKLKSSGNALKPAAEQKPPADEKAIAEPVPHLEQQPPVEEQSLSEPEPAFQFEQPLPDEEAVAAEPEPVSQPMGKIDELGKSEAERDDSFAWLEALAAKQGASEGLLTKPEERLEQEPEWVKQVKKSTGELQPPPVEEAVTSEPGPVSQTMPVGSLDELGRSEVERDDSFAWLESLAARQGATEGLLTKPEERLEEEPDWVRRAKELKEETIAPSGETPVQAEPEPVMEEIVPAGDVPSWLKGLDEEKEEGEPAPVVEDETTTWLKSLDEPQEEPITFASSAEDLPAWMQEIGEAEVSETESAVPMGEAEVVAESPASVQESAPEEIPDWLHSLEEEEQTPVIPVSDDLPAWMRDETGEVVAEPTKIEPTRSSDWTPLDETKVEAVKPPPPVPQPAPEPKAAPAPKAKKPKKELVKPAAPPEPYREPITTIRGTGMLTMPVDPLLVSARAELSRSNIPGALEAYGKLIKKGRFLEEVIFDLREALYRYPVEVSIWQALGDAYVRANQLQDALDAYTKAEELLR